MSADVCLGGIAVDLTGGLEDEGTKSMLQLFKLSLPSTCRYILYICGDQRMVCLDTN